MKSNSVSRTLGIALVIVSVFAVVGVLTFAGPCVHEDGSTSICHGASVAVLAGGIVAALAAAISLFVKNAKVVGVLFVIVACAGLFVAASCGTLFPLCMMETMRCRLVMQPFSQVIGIVIAALGAIAAIRALRSSEGGVSS